MNASWVWKMNERLTWEEISKKNPDQWVGFSDVEYEPDNSSTIKSAIVKYIGKSKKELTLLRKTALESS